MKKSRAIKKKIRGGTCWHASAPISLDEMRARSPFDEDLLQFLQASTVLIFGAGSGGSKLALDLARAGVGRLMLCDPGSLALHNLARHIGTLEDVGQPKTDVVARQVLARVPGVQVESYPSDIFTIGSMIDPSVLAESANLLIGATDRVSVQLKINELAWQVGKPAVFGGCYEAARGGEVFFTLPGSGTPCLACLRGGLAPPPPQGPFDYSMAHSLEDYQGQPGLAAAVDLVTDIEAQVALAVLLRHSKTPLARLADPRLCFLLIGGALGSGYYRFNRPFDIHYQSLAGPRPDCPVCQIPQKSSIQPTMLAEGIPDDFQNLWDSNQPGQ